MYELCTGEKLTDGKFAQSESECKCLTCNQKTTVSQFSLLHEPNLMVNGGNKTKKKTIEQSGVRKCSPMEGVVYGGKVLRKRYLLSLEWNRVGMMDNDSDGSDELRELG